MNTQHDWLVNIVEQYDISMEDIRNGLYTGNELTSMNIFAFRPDTFGFMENKVGLVGFWKWKKLFEYQEPLFVTS